MKTPEELHDSLKDLTLAAATKRLSVLILCLISLFIGLTVGLLCGLSLGRGAF